MKIAILREGRFTLFSLFLLTLPMVTLKIRGADEIEYFSYLRSFVFDHDLEFGNEYQYFYQQDPKGLAGFKATFLDLREPRTGRHINFAPMGSAILWSPFYLLAHGGVLVARSLGSEITADGFSTPYIAAVCYASAFYGFLGLLLIHQILHRFGLFSVTVTTYTLVALWLGTPVLYYLTLAPAFSHGTSLFVVALLLWLWLRSRERDEERLQDWIVLGFVGGLTGLVREQDALFLLIPGIDLVLRTIRRQSWFLGFSRALIAGFVAAVVFIPQLLAYRALNGTFGPSRMVARKMTYTSPHFFQVLFDPGHGLFLWSPLLLFATIGLFLSFVLRRERRVMLLNGVPEVNSGTAMKRGAPGVPRNCSFSFWGGPPAPRTPGHEAQRLLTLCLSVGLLSQIWINGSLESWTQAGAFGSRRFISATPLFAWGLAFLLSVVRPWLGRFLPPLFLSLCIWWNVSLMIQFGLKLMNRQGLTWPQVAVNQVVEVPPRLWRVALLFFTDREQLVREGTR